MKNLIIGLLFSLTAVCAYGLEPIVFELDATVISEGFCSFEIKGEAEMYSKFKAPCEFEGTVITYENDRPADFLITKAQLPEDFFENTNNVFVSDEVLELAGVNGRALGGRGGMEGAGVGVSPSGGVFVDARAGNADSVGNAGTKIKSRGTKVKVDKKGKGSVGQPQERKGSPSQSNKKSSDSDWSGPHGRWS